MSKFESSFFTLTDDVKIKIESEELISDDYLVCSHRKNSHTILKEIPHGTSGETHAHFSPLKSQEEKFTCSTAAPLPITFVTAIPGIFLEHVDYSSLIQRNLKDETDVDDKSEDPLNSTNGIDYANEFPAADKHNSSPTIDPVQTIVCGDVPTKLRNNKNKKHSNQLIKHRSRNKRHIPPGQCRICKKHFDTPKIYEHHFSLHPGENPYKCEMCGISFSLKRGWAHHMRVHSIRICNVAASKRYRQKKKLEAANVKEVEDVIEKENDVLENECNDLRRQIVIVKQLIREVFTQCRRKSNPGPGEY